MIDPKTERQLEKWRISGHYSEINGCISTGKEANVYFAKAGEKYGVDIAIKIYKVETMVFRDREEYIDGERRFSKGQSRTNPRKLIKLWAEKEYRNLKRMHDNNLPSPKPLRIFNNLLLMEFVGENTIAAKSKNLFF